MKAFLLSILFFALPVFADQLPTYEDIHQQLSQKVEDSKELLRGLTDEGLDLKVIENRKQYFAEGIIRVRIFEKPLAGYYWETIVELKNVTCLNIDEKANELMILAEKEYQLQFRSRQNEYQTILSAHSHAESERTLDDGSLALEMKGKHLVSWIQIPTSDDNPIKWMRTTVLVSKNVEDNNPAVIGIKSSIWSFTHKEKFYDQSEAGLMELGLIEANLKMDGSGDIILNIFNTSTTKSYDLSNDLTFFYTLGASLSLDFILSASSQSAYCRATGVTRVGVVFADKVIISLGVNAGINFKNKIYVDPNLKLTINGQNFSFTIMGGYSINNGFDENLYILNSGWNAGISFKINL